ncbi:hypothetical protein CIHG_07059 [Coccidioides immitis H538.4]|uniref:Uncharacterized protein n=1 Tax=Coccidioides immitis H538.4 TaxID=396776 RepID=A0A0J8RWI3_COCIT|nr:hypothetical protein CIHG_07059 [Coccidioides immitis H538.4]
MAQFDTISSIDLSGSPGYMYPVHFGGLARRHSNRITKIPSAGNSPRNCVRGDIMPKSGSHRRFSTQSDKLAASFYAALQKATASRLDLAPMPSYQLALPLAIPPTTKEDVSANAQVTAASDSFMDWGFAEMSALANNQAQFETISTQSPFDGYLPPQQPVCYQEPEPESDWPTYIPMVSSTSIDSEYSHSPRANTPLNCRVPISRDTTAASSPELFSYREFPEPKTPPSFSSESTNKSEEVLVGVGLYDEPDAVSWDESSRPNHYRIGAIGGPLFRAEPLVGKGLKLEETFSPPPLESDDDDDAKSETG